MNNFMIGAHNKNISGFTLIELVIYGGLLGILLTIMSQFFISTMQLKTITHNETSVQIDGRYIVSRLAYDMRRATTITEPMVGQSGSTLSAIIRENGTDVLYRYTISNQDVVLFTGSTSAVLNSADTHIQHITFQRIGNSATVAGAKDTLKVNIAIEGSATTSSGKQSATFSTSVGLR